MKRVELKARFNSFYNESYPRAMAYCIAMTGDFINGEDILADTYYNVYKRVLKDKKGEIKDLDGYLFSSLKNRIATYWKKHQKERSVSVPLEEWENLGEILYTEFDLTAETAVKQMLVQDILEYVSSRPLVMRRAFAMHFYLGHTLEETAIQLQLPVSTVRNYIYRLLREVRENFLDEYEQER